MSQLARQYKDSLNRQRSASSASAKTPKTEKRLVAMVNHSPNANTLILTIERRADYIRTLNETIRGLALVNQKTESMLSRSAQSGRLVTRTLLTYSIPDTDRNTHALFRLARTITQTGAEVFRMQNPETRQHFLDVESRIRQAAKSAKESRERDAPVIPTSSTGQPLINNGMPMADTRSHAQDNTILPVSRRTGTNGQPLEYTQQQKRPTKRSSLDSADITVMTGTNPANQKQATALMIRNTRDNEGLYEQVLSHPGARYVKATKGRSGYFRVPISDTTPDLIRLLTNRYGLVPESTVPTLGNQPFVQAIKARLAHLKNTYRLSNMDSLADQQETLGNLPDIPRPKGLDYLPYQEAGIRYAVSLGNALIADEPGLGKTIQAVGVSNAVAEARRILVIPPASLKINWEREWKKWCAKGLSVARVQDGRPENWPTDSDVVILNFDLVAQHHNRLTDQPWDLLIIDEAHALKTADAKRTKLILGHGTGRNHTPGIPAKRKIFLTGTPILNRPAEIWPLAHALDPDFFSDKFQFEARYCDAHKTDYGWNARGASNLAELNRQLRARIMVRRQKAQVLKDLPPKTRQLIELDQPSLAAHNDVFSKLAAAQDSLKTIYDRRERLRETAQRGDITSKQYLDQASTLAAEARVAFHQMSLVRKETALAKVPQVMELIKTSLDNGKLILFCHHHEVVEAYADALNQHFRKQAGKRGTPSTIAIVTGQTKNDDRQKQADTFQEDERCKVFIGTIGAAGTGYTLTAASTVLFAELDWVPGNMNQAEDRAHRIGQLDHVLVYHTAIEHSLESRMVRRLIEKQATIDAALDDDLSVSTITPEDPHTPQSFEQWLADIAESAASESLESETELADELNQALAIDDQVQVSRTAGTQTL